MESGAAPAFDIPDVGGERLAEVYLPVKGSMPNSNKMKHSKTKT